MFKRLIQEKKGLPVPASKGLPAVPSSKDLTPPATNELQSRPPSAARGGLRRVVWILAAIAAMLLFFRSNAFDLRDGLIGLAGFFLVGVPILRSLRKRRSL